MPSGMLPDCIPNQKRFLNCFSVCARVGLASRWAHLSPFAHKNWMREDPTYPARFALALRDASRCIEDEAVRRAVEGIRKPVRYKGRIVGHVQEYSDTLLLALLRAYEPERFHERSSVEHSGPGGAAIPTEISLVFVRPGQSGVVAAPQPAQLGSAPSTGPEPAIDVQWTASEPAAAPAESQEAAPDAVPEPHAALLAEIAKLKREGKRLRTRLANSSQPTLSSE